MKNNYQEFLPSFRKASSEFGGGLLKGKRKSARPISVKMPMHLILKSNELIFCKKLKLHRSVVQKFAKKFHVKIMMLEFNGNHVHLIIRVFQRAHYNSFVRAVTSRMAAIANLKKAFTLRPYTRFVKWGRDLKNAFSYLNINGLEADGLPRENARLLNRLLSEGFWRAGPKARG